MVFLGVLSAEKPSKFLRCKNGCGFALPLLTFLVWVWPGSTGRFVVAGFGIDGKQRLYNTNHKRLFILLLEGRFIAILPPNRVCIGFAGL